MAVNLSAKRSRSVECCHQIVRREHATGADALQMLDGSEAYTGVEHRVGHGLAQIAVLAVPLDRIG